MRKSNFDILRHDEGFSLIEVVMALGICSFCLIALIGLLSQGLTTNRDTVSQTEAAGIARMVQADLAVRPVDSNGVAATSSQRYQIPASANKTKTFLVTADGTTESDPQKADFRVDVSLGKTNFAVEAIPVYILVTWPAAANPSGAISKPVSSFEAATAILPP